MKIIVMNCNKSKEQRCQEAQVHNELLSQMKAQTPEGCKRKEQFGILRNAINESFAQVDVSLLKYRKYRMILALGYAAFLSLIPGSPVMAASNGDGGVAILKLMQQASFWVGIAVVVWGIVEAQLDLPGWKGRIFKGIGGYIAILLVPLLFISLRENLQIDVWQKLK